MGCVLELLIWFCGKYTSSQNNHNNLQDTALHGIFFILMLNSLTAAYTGNAVAGNKAKSPFGNSL
ncbi:hypothetical protein A4S02_05395 [Acetobacter ascendens]|uniref:Uncharacterized protein n=1 Tax=Acetobacter ascendens TaxID=481146 RepID=A0A1D8QVE4_9PROT|nr:hypothetical protein A4S02_05395 [Acetobacter ascendens]